MGHIHAELMKQYAEDAAETDRPWERWEYHAPGDNWRALNGHPWWAPAWAYRRRPRTININGFEVPEPVREPLDRGDKYFLASPQYGDSFDEYLWVGDVSDNRWLSRGLIHRTEEAAVLHAKALLSFTKVAADEE